MSSFFVKGVLFLLKHSCFDSGKVIPCRHSDCSEAEQRNLEVYGNSIKNNVVSVLFTTQI